jgi:predicted dehydrogenase
MAKRDLRLGLIGAGPWGRTYINAIAAIDGLKLTRLASRNPKSRSLVDPACRISEDWREVAEALDLDGVIIAAPPHLHAKMAIAAVTFGRPVLVEKPLTMDLAQAAELRRHVVLYDGLVMVDHIHLFHPAFRALKELSRALGQIKAIRADAGNRGPYREGVPVIWDWGAHDVAMCLDLMGGVPEKIRAERLASETIDGGRGENLFLGLSFAGGVEAEIHIGNMMEKKRRFKACFADATLVYDGLAEKPLRLHPPTNGIDTPLGPGEIIDVAGDLPLDVALKEFATAIVTADACPASLDLGVAVTGVLAECEKALAE